MDFILYFIIVLIFSLVFAFLFNEALHILLNNEDEEN